jgi:hypothetical protein
MSHCLSVHAFTPAEGEAGIPITVRVQLHNIPLDAVWLRISFGSHHCHTDVQELPKIGKGVCQLDATVPAVEDTGRDATDKVPLSVDVIDSDCSVVDTVTIGDFSYWIAGQFSSHSLCFFLGTHLPCWRRRP